MAIVRWLLNPHTTFIVRVLMLSTFIIAAFLAIATYFHPHWPADNDGWFSFALIFAIVWFLAIKVYEMTWPVWMEKSWSRLGMSLIMVNVSFAIAYSLSIFFSLWPQLARSEWVRIALRVEVLAFLLWSVYELTKRPRPYSGIKPRTTFVLTLLALIAVTFLLFRIEVIEWNGAQLGHWISKHFSDYWPPHR